MPAFPDPRPVTGGPALIGSVAPPTVAISVASGPVPVTAQAGASRGTAPAPEVDPRETVVHAAIAATAAVLWLVSLPAVDLSRMSGWGLLPALPWTWYLALGSVPAYLVAAARGRCRAWVLALYQLVLLAVLFATTSATYQVPRFSWTYKHIGVTEHLLAAGTLDRGIDIYNNWPGMFLWSAAISRITGVGPMTLAQWAEPCFAVMTSAAVLFAVSALTRDRRVLWVALLTFTLGNWIAQNYYSPQALAFALSLVVLGCVLRWVPLRDAGGRPALRPGLARRVPAAVRRLTPPALAPADEWVSWAPAIATVLFAAVVVTHQLTPVALILQLAVVVAVFRVRGAWLVPLWCVLELAWVALAWPFVAQRWSLFQPGMDTPSDGQPAAAATLPGMDVVARAPMLLVAAVGVLALVGFGRRLRHGELDLLPACLLIAPPCFLALQTYGGEGLFRAYLFALPWLSYLIATLVVARWPVGRGGRTAIAVATVATAAVCCLSVLSMLGSELVDYVSPRDVAASRWFETSTPPGAYTVVLTGAGEFPLLLTSDYPRHITPSIVITDSPRFVPGHTSTATLLAIAEDALTGGAPGGYLAISQHQITLATMNGQIATGQADQLISAVRQSPGFRVVYLDQHIVIARWAGTAARTRP
jgi:hypothetical protein